MSDRLTPLAQLLNPFFENLNNINLSYCVTGNYASLPEFTSHDVDIWVEDIETIRKVLYRTAYQQNFKVHLIYRTGSGLCNIFHRFEEDASISLIRLDLVTELNWRSVFSLIPGKIVGEDRRLFKNFYVCDPSVEAASKLLYCLIREGKIRDKYKEIIFSRRKFPFFFKILKQAVGEQSATWLLNQIDSKKWDEIDGRVNWLRIQVIKQNILNFDIKRIQIGINALFFYVKRFINPVGFFGAFVGPDGCGKSTLCERIPQVLSAGFMREEAKTFYWRPMLLPRIQKLLSFGLIKARREEFTGSGQHHSPPDGYFLSVFKFFYYYFDFLFGSLKFYSFRAKGGVVLFDRYYHDFFVYPERFRLKLPGWFFRIFMPIIPHPDIIFYLDVSPKSLINRKEEVSLEELMRHVSSYRELVSSLPNTYMIDADKPLVNVVNEISKIILDCMSQRIEKK